MSRPAFVPCSAQGLHPWIPNCNLMALDLFRHSVQGGIKLYAPLFIIPAIFRKRKQMKENTKSAVTSTTSSSTSTSTSFTLAGVNWANTLSWIRLMLRTAFEILRSSVFLGTYSSLFGRFFCLQRHLLQADYLFIPWTSGFFAGLVAICVERSNRRLELGLYCLNQSVEVLWRMARRRGVKAINNGEVAIFSLASAIIMYFYQHDPASLRGNVRALFQFLLGNN